jgi:hypothetical protein
MAAQTPGARERYGVILLPTDIAFTDLPAAAVPDLGVSAGWVACGIARALIVHYVAGEGQDLPQAAKVRAVLAAWAKEHGYQPVRTAVLASQDEAEVLR